MRSGVLLVALVALIGGVGFWGVRVAANHVLDKVDRIADPFAGIQGARPQVTQGLTILLAGLDDRSKVPLTGSNAQSSPEGRADSVMLLRIPADRSSASIVSLPRDSWVPVPDHGYAKLNAAFALGGPSLLIQTVEKLTALHIDHLAFVDWDGFRALTDAVGGVEINFPVEGYDPVHKIRFPAGKHVLDGKKALWYVRQRYGLPRGDLDRMQHQQNFLKALFTKIRQGGTFSDPAKVRALVGLATSHVTVDEGFTNDDLFSLALDAPKVGAHVSFVTAPIDGFKTIGGQSVVMLDLKKVPPFFAALGKDQLASYLSPSPSPQPSRSA
jgi:LCP family protein required for cell wall assembly